jgi:hypothetical protein
LIITNDLDLPLVQSSVRGNSVARPFFFGGDRLARRITFDREVHWKNTNKSAQAIVIWRLYCLHQTRARTESVEKYQEQRKGEG